MIDPYEGRAVPDLTEEELQRLERGVAGHLETGEEEFFLGTAELYLLLLEVRARRGHRCPDHSNEYEPTWGYDG